jgi:hypothetical protein
MIITEEEIDELFRRMTRALNRVEDTIAKNKLRAA